MSGQHEHAKFLAQLRRDIVARMKKAGADGATVVLDIRGTDAVCEVVLRDGTTAKLKNFTERRRSLAGDVFDWRELRDALGRAANDCAEVAITWHKLNRRNAAPGRGG